MDNRLAAELGVKPLGDSELVQALKVGGFGKWLGGNGENGVELERSPRMNFDGHFCAAPFDN